MDDHGPNGDAFRGVTMWSNWLCDEGLPKSVGKTDSHALQILPSSLALQPQEEKAEDKMGLESLLETLGPEIDDVEEGKTFLYLYLPMLRWSVITVGYHEVDLHP